MHVGTRTHASHATGTKECWRYGFRHCRDGLNILHDRFTVGRTVKRRPLHSDRVRGAGLSGLSPPAALLRASLIILGLLLPLNLPFSIPPVGKQKLFGWTGDQTSGAGGQMIVSHTTRHARTAGLRPGDVLLAIDGEPATEATLERKRGGAQVGDTLLLRVERSATVLDVAVPVSANLASYSGYIAYRVLVVLAAWAVGMALLFWRGRQLEAFIMAAALITVAPSAFPNGVTGEGLILSGARTVWQLLATGNRILFPVLLFHFLMLHIRGAERFRSRRVWVLLYAVAIGLVIAVTNGLTDLHVRSQAGWQYELRLAGGGLFELLVVFGALTLWWQLRDRGQPLRWLSFVILIYAAASLAHALFALLEPPGPDLELVRRARAVLLGLLPITVALHFSTERLQHRQSDERRQLASVAGVLLTLIYASALAGVAAVVLGATQTNAGGVEWLLFAAIFIAAVILSPVLRWARELVDRRATAPWAETEACLRRFIDGLCAELDPERIGRRATMELPALLGVRSCCIVLDEDLTRSWELKPETRLTQAPQAELLLRLADANGARGQRTVPIERADGEMIGLLVVRDLEPDAPEPEIPHRILRVAAHGLASALRTAGTYVELRRAQRDLAEAERIAAMGALAGGLAHEIKNPLASLKMGLHLLERDSPDVTRIRRIQWDLRRIDDLVSGFLQFTKDREEERAEVLDLRQITRSCVEDLRSHATSSRIRIVERYPTQAAIVVASAGRLRLVVSNLLRNAIEAVGEDGRIEIDIRLAEAHLELLLRDSGSGIPADKREQVFTLGYSTKPGGTGLGLALARREVDRLRGRIEVVADGEERGTTLRLVLPTPIYST